MKKFISWKILAVILVTLVLALYDLPTQTQKSILPFLPDSLINKLHLGLDLQGGSQLDYKIDLRKVPEADKESIVEGVKGVIEKRVNGLGVAEPNIYVTDVGDEKHIVIELAETTNLTQEDVDNYLDEKKTLDQLTDDEKKQVSLEKAKATVGKTIQLEFKEEKGSMDPQEKDKIRTNAQTALDKIKKGTEFAIVGQEEQQAYPGKVKYEKTDYIFDKDIPSKLKDTVTKLKKGEYTKELIETGGTFSVDTTGQTIENTGLAIVRLLDTKEEVKNEKEIYTSHILISYKGLENADASITRTEEEAYDLAKEIKTKLDNGESFTTLAKQYSDDKSNKDSGGKLDLPVTGDGTYVYDYEQTALKLEKDKVSDPIKTQFGYHLIKIDDIKTNVAYPKYQYETITYSTIPDPWKETGLTGKQFVHADVQLDQFYTPYVQIQFNDEGAKLFEEITGRNVGKRLAIFIGGEEISAPKVNEKIAGGKAQISGQFTNEEAKILAMNLNTGAIPAPIILTGEYTIGATLGQETLNQSMNASIIGAFLVIAFMVLWYRIAGLIASLALGTYISILLFLLKAQLSLGLALIISLAVFIFLVVKILNNKDSGWEKFLSFLLSCIAFFFLTYLLKSGVVLTLAGIAGIVLSIGMAVDANVLIFERFKEEIRSGKSFTAALDAGFIRAWDAIRDSNFSTLITCAILFFMGSSTIKGFAFNLSAGIVVSMFTAITITRILLNGFVGKKIAQNMKTFIGLNTEKSEPKIKFIKNSKYFLIVSGILTAASIISLFVFGLNLGTDFKGGTLLEFNFSTQVTKEEIATKFTEIEKEINSTKVTATVPETTTPPTTTPTATTTKDTELQNEEASAKVNLTMIKIISTGETSYIIKTPYITSADHDVLLAKMKERLPKFSESRFTTIGPTIGKSLLNKAITATIIALIMIIIYIGFAFRKIPKEVSPWRFGICAIIALIHDVLIVTGLFILFGKLFNAEVDALFITAILTVFGYSVNDTIIIFDRIRENLIHAESGKNLEAITDQSLNQTLARSLNTTITTMIAIMAVLIFGSHSIFFFIMALTLGIGIGAYSSLFIASPILVYWNNWVQNKKR